MITSIDREHTRIVADEFRRMGFVTICDTVRGQVYVGLRSRRIAAHEVEAALDQAELPELPLSRMGGGFIIDCRG